MLLFLLALDLLLICLVGTIYSLVTREAQRGHDIVLELTNYRHLAEDMLPVLRWLLLFAMLVFACLCSMQAGQVWISPSG